MISFDEALAIVAAQVRPLPAETVDLDAASGRVLAAPCVAQVASPPADISMMDGYALRDADLADATPFRVIGTAYPGTAFDGNVGQGEAVRVFTGAPVPAGADRVVVQEEIRRDQDRATVLHPSPGKRHIRAFGSDFARAIFCCRRDGCSIRYRWSRPRAQISAR